MPKKIAEMDVNRFRATCHQYPVRLFPFATALNCYSERKVMDELARAIDLVRAHTGEQHVLVALDWVESQDALRAARRVADRTRAAVVALAGEHRNADLSPIVYKIADDVVEVHEPDELHDMSEPPFQLDGVKGCIGFHAGYAELDWCVVQRM